MTKRQKKLREEEMLKLEINCTGYYTRHPEKYPDGSFMQRAFHAGYKAGKKEPKTCRLGGEKEKKG